MTGLLLAGFILGLRHALDADHVAAVSTLVRDRVSVRDSIKHGVVWGIGHTATLLLCAVFVFVFGGNIKASVAQGLEMAVGVLLIVLGIGVIRSVRRQKIHFHVHQHGEGVSHFHAHSHTEDDRDLRHDASSMVAHDHSHASKLPVRTLLVGLMHGLAGSSALIFLTLDSAETKFAALSHVLVFGLGSILGMAVLTAVIAWPLRRSAQAMNSMYGILHYGLGAFTAGLGLLILLEPLQLFA